MEAKHKKILLIVLACCTVFGAVLRFVNLDKKEFWHDECETTLVLSGQTESQLWTQLSKGPVTARDLLNFQKIGPASSPENMLEVLKQDEPGHTPLFYVLEYVVGLLLGCSSLAMRLLPAIFGVMQLPIVFILAREIWESDEMAWISTAFAALSPTLIYFSQEARDYSLALLMMFLSSLCLLRALRMKTIRSWIVYSVCLATGFYSSLFMFVVAVGHFLYVNLSDKLNLKDRLIPFSFSLVSTAVLFGPWLSILQSNQTNFDKAHAWLNNPVPMPALIQVWTSIPSKAIALYGDATNTMGGALLAITIFQLLSLIALVIISLNNKKVTLLTALAAGWYAVFALPDAYVGGIRSVPFRHQTVAIASFLLLTPALFKALIGSEAKFLRITGLVLCATLLAVEAQSSLYVVECQTFPDKAIRERYLKPVADLANSENAPVLLEQTGANSCEILGLSRLLKPEISVYAHSFKDKLILPASNRIFLFNPAPALEDKLSLTGYNVHSLAGISYLKEAEKF